MSRPGERASACRPMAAAYCGPLRERSDPDPEPAWPPGPGERRGCRDVLCSPARWGWASASSRASDHASHPEEPGIGRLSPRHIEGTLTANGARLQMARSPARRALDSRRLLSSAKRCCCGAESSAHAPREPSRRGRGATAVAASRSAAIIDAARRGSDMRQAVTAKRAGTGVGPHADRIGDRRRRLRGKPSCKALARSGPQARAFGQSRARP